EILPDHQSNSGSSRTPTPPGQQPPYSYVDREPCVSPRRRLVANKPSCEVKCETRGGGRQKSPRPPLENIARVSSLDLHPAS
ncbi:PDZ and LIM domain protein 2-like, partial [Arapaima gigas]